VGIQLPGRTEWQTVTQIRQTSHGGYIAVGRVIGIDLNLGALIFKFGSAGTMRVSLRELREI